MEKNNFYKSRDRPGDPGAARVLQQSVPFLVSDSQVLTELLSCSPAQTRNFFFTTFSHLGIYDGCC